MTSRITIGNNGKGVTPVTEDEVAQALLTLRRRQLTANESFPGFDRASLLSPWGQNRKEFNLDRECGYSLNPTKQEYTRLYCRGGIAARVVDIWPDECWAVYPELYETDKNKITKWERAWRKLAERVLPWHYIHRADRLSGVGRFGIMLLGLNDGRELSTPAPNVDPVTGEGKENPAPVELNYLRVFDETLVRVSKVDSDVNSPRYQFPVEYQIGVPNTTPEISDQRIDITVHWTRVLHLADGCKSSEVYGTPRLESVLNLLHDIHKVQGGSAEMFIKAGFPILSFETYPDIAGESAIDFDDVRAEVEKYERGYQRFFANVGGKWVALSPQVANPANHLEQYLNMMCATLGVPTRVFMGTEAAHLASTQDVGIWKDRLRGRQVNYLEPMVVRPFINRLMAIGVLPRVPRYYLSWRDLRSLSDKDRADVALKQCQTLMQYIAGGVEGLYEYKMFLTNIMGYSEEQADAIADVRKRKEIGPLPIQAPAGSQAGGRSGNPNQNPVGKPPGTAPEGT